MLVGTGGSIMALSWQKSNLFNLCLICLVAMLISGINNNKCSFITVGGPI